MKNQLQSPIEILIQILVVIVIDTIQLLFVVGKLLYDLYISLQIMAQTSIPGLFLALFVGGIILFFSIKFLFKSTTSVIKIMTIYIIFVIFLMYLMSV